MVGRADPRSAGDAGSNPVDLAAVDLASKTQPHDSLVVVDRIEGHLFAEVAQLVRTMVPDGLGDVRTRAHRRGIKVWFGPTTPTREHFEAQIIPGHHVDEDGPVLEVGFHAEHPDESANQAIADVLESNRGVWGDELGAHAELGHFHGRDSWRRLSETWPGAGELDNDPDAAFEIACRLIDYLSVIEPLRTG